MPPSQVLSLLRQKVKYVFVLYQENRSFDSYFGTFPGASGLFSQPPDQTPGFVQPMVKADGSLGTIRPFRIGPDELAADTDDLDHSHGLLVQKMNIQRGQARMDQFAMIEERKFSYAGSGPPPPRARQMGELTMAYMDCDTVPLYWTYADRFVLFDHIFQLMAGPSTLGNLSIIAAQTGQTQWALHPALAYTDDGSGARGVPIMNDNDPFWGSAADPNPKALKMPVAPRDLAGIYEYGTALNLTFASLPLTLLGRDIQAVTRADRYPSMDLPDVERDIPYIAQQRRPRIPFGWFQEGYGKEPTDPDDGPVDAYGLHASYVTHHNGPQFFGYVSNNPKMQQQLHSLVDFFDAVDGRALPRDGGLFFVKGGFQNIMGLKPAGSSELIQRNFRGDDDHPGYSDAQISEALVANCINKIAQSPYWDQSAIIVAWDDSEGMYDHVPPPATVTGPDGTVIGHGPRVPLILISPFARTHAVAHGSGNHASVVKFVNQLFQLPALASLPDEKRGLQLGEQVLGRKQLGPADLDPGLTDLVEGFSPARLSGRARPLPASYGLIPKEIIAKIPQQTGYGCKDLGITTTDRAGGVENVIPKDFNPRPLTIPTSP